jgi:hypothetical protein
MRGYRDLCNRTTPHTILMMIILCSSSVTPLVSAQTGTLELEILDKTTGKTVPARVEIRASDGMYHVAEDALPVGGDCDTSDEGAGYIDLGSTLDGFKQEVENPYTRTTQFYSTGNSRVKLTAGNATIRVFRGPEYLLHVSHADIRVDETVPHAAVLHRWINMPERGWYGSDDHLHIPRPVPELDPYISKMMQAEDIHVANLLQMGKVRNKNIAPQYSHGPLSHYGENGYILAAGIENPRTHFLGHTITLGAETALHFPELYLVYRLAWQEAVDQGGINGYAHGWATSTGAIVPHNGMAVVLPHDLMHFIEVLQFNRYDFETWYDILNLGFRVAPTAGSDYPCADQNIPGHERFYTRVEGELTYERWLEGVRNGRTFVTTGPMLEFSINGADIGDEIKLEKASSLKIEGRVLFDVHRDDVQLIEVIRDGEVIRRISRVSDPGRIDFRFDYPVRDSTWFALRGYGQNRLEIRSSRPFHFNLWDASSCFHSAPIYVSIAGTPAIGENSRVGETATAWLARLEDMEIMLAPENIEYILMQYRGGNDQEVPREVFLNNREQLLVEIRDAKLFFMGLLK